MVRWEQLAKGASALIAYTMAQRAFSDLPPLRAAQIGFVAPISEEVELSAKIERQGRNVTQLRSEIHCNGQLALSAFWLFGTARDANAVYHAERPSDWPDGPENWDEVNLSRSPPFLSGNYEMRRAQKERGPGAPVVRRWFRLKEDMPRIRRSRPAPTPPTVPTERTPGILA